MGWSSGSQMMEEIIETVEDLVPNFNTRKEMYKRFIEIFEDNIILSVTNREFSYINNFGQEFFFTDIDLEWKIFLDN